MDTLSDNSFGKVARELEIPCSFNVLSSPTNARFFVTFVISFPPFARAIVRSITLVANTSAADTTIVSIIEELFFFIFAANCVNLPAYLLFILARSLFFVAKKALLLLIHVTKELSIDDEL